MQAVRSLRKIGKFNGLSVRSLTLAASDSELTLDILDGDSKGWF